MNPSSETENTYQELNYDSFVSRIYSHSAQSLFHVNMNASKMESMKEKQWLFGRKVKESISLVILEQN